MESRLISPVNEIFPVPALTVRLLFILLLPVRLPSIVIFPALAAKIFKLLAVKELFVIASPALTGKLDEVTVTSFVGDVISPVVNPDPLIRSGKVVGVIPLANALGSTSRLIKPFG